MSTLYILTYFKVFVSKDDVLDKGSADIKNFIKGMKISLTTLLVVYSITQSKSNR